MNKLVGVFLVFFCLIYLTQQLSVNDVEKQRKEFQSLSSKYQFIFFQKNAKEFSIKHPEIDLETVNSFLQKLFYSKKSSKTISKLYQKMIEKKKFLLPNSTLNCLKKTLKEDNFFDLFSKCQMKQQCWEKNLNLNHNCFLKKSTRNDCYNDCMKSFNCLKDGCEFVTPNYWDTIVKLCAVRNENCICYGSQLTKLIFLQHRSCARKCSLTPWMRCDN